jgi:aspartyl-tRNA(Asn)/glutamyl-tRNA(Gln) amidotransferase subunit A
MREQGVADRSQATGLADFSRSLHAGETSTAALVERYLQQIEAREAEIGAFEHLAADEARQTAAAIDALIAAGGDLGSLMGLPIVVKDTFAVDGMPVTAGSNVEVADLIGLEGGFVKRLRRAGCIVLGKSRTIEFALGGAGGVNTRRGSPRNPHDRKTHRGCGGSSSGSAAALAAGFCAFSIGSDTGGSIRIPAAFCGLVGYKPTTGLWPMDGVFPLCETLDTVGLLTNSAADAAFIHAALEGADMPLPRPLGRLRLGVLTKRFAEGLDLEVAEAMHQAMARLRATGAEIIEVEMPDGGPPEDYFHAIVPGEFIANFGRERFMAVRDRLGPDIAARGDAGLTLTAERYVTMQRRRRKLAALAHEAIAGFDAWLSPTVDMVAPPVSAFAETKAALSLNARIGRLTRPVNLCDFCMLSLPIPGASLPVGLQLMAARHQDRSLLAIAMGIEQALAAK